MAVWLLEAGALDTRRGRAVFTAEQGDGIGRPGRLRIEVIAAADRTPRVRVGGHAVTVRSGNLRA
jgi:predicted PhzF superfamily epimerase YddE/YHI9